jgi:thiol-disulfide isomerase/thioredoxin
MRRIRLRALAALAIGGWFVAIAATTTPVRAADRPAGQILADIDAVVVPKLDTLPPDQRNDPLALTEFLSKRKAALAQRGKLIFELFHVAPDHPQLPELFSDRWQDQLRTASGPQAIPAITTELDEVFAQAKTPKLKADAAFYKTILDVQTGEGGVEEVLKSVEKFIKIAPQDERGAMLLNAIATELKGSPRQAELYRRVVAGYPESPYADPARRNLKRLESVGKPFELEFTDLKGNSIAMKDLRGKVVVVDFWGTFCEPCVAEMPKLKEQYARYHGQGVEFIGVSLEGSKEEGGLDLLKDFIARNEIPWPQYYQGNGWDSAFSSSWGIDVLPAMFVIDQDGKIASVEAFGRLDEILPELLKKGGTEKTDR